jgi:tRNA(fMet)-specific endonuclease VapC
VESTSVGVILDSSVIIAAERRGRTVRQFLEQVRTAQGGIEIGISVVSIAEPHVAFRATTQEQKERRLEFVERLTSDVPVDPITLEIARIVGPMEAQLEAKGIQLAFEDLLIGVTALHLGYNLATLNLRHFQQLPGLLVVQL